ncbi:twin-arginine translocation pathway signal protein [Brevirhabdus pacifica]|uniref:Twin-arginine translocation pathway signal protein n=1 Tax=Brevirhabdus pacifica TaxID=1267768 RepID=A0A1U7DKI2_9RHOB|nr:twin-arginine translocation pathway signal protein [Brevirhabdus pacifica]APX90496.1 twin-arginine translocation pathway signal protein [Brevirhabdus pacifica]OWU78490.1 twin-arginine translocation pathway signal protein [Loktanella sp. 22II-4b]PJJ85393.1 secreted protein [Brevirhabdus pacifica]
MSKRTDGEKANRRNFLKLASVSAPAAAAAVLTGTQAEAADALDDGKREGMQDTAHTRAYYDSARF